MFPEFFDSPLDVSFVGKARESSAVSVEVIALRDYGLGPQKQLDDAPFGARQRLRLWVHDDQPISQVRA